MAQHKNVQSSYFSQFDWEQYQKDVFRFILSKVKDEDFAKDILQEVYLKAFTKIDQLIDPFRLKSWLFSIAHNQIVSEWNKRKKITEIANNNLQGKEIESEKQFDHTIYDCLDGIIQKLSNKYQIPLVSYYKFGKKQWQISKELAIPLPSIKSQIQRGRSIIKEKLKECCGFSEDKNGYLIGEVKPLAECKVCRRLVLK